MTEVTGTLLVNFLEKREDPYNGFQTPTKGEPLL